VSGYRILVTGSREWPDYDAVWSEIAGLALLHPHAVVVHGAHRDGADRFAAQAARAVGLAEEPHPARWKQWNRRAWPFRNAEMVAAGADICLAFIAPCAQPSCRKLRPHGSHGASGCADLAYAAGIDVRRFTL
jgi:hypothetical protein